MQVIFPFTDLFYSLEKHLNQQQHDVSVFIIYKLELHDIMYKMIRDYDITWRNFLTGPFKTVTFAR